MEVFSPKIMFSKVESGGRWGVFLYEGEILKGMKFYRLKLDGT